MGTIKIALVDDHQLFRAGIKALLNEVEDMRVILESGDGQQFLDVLRTTSLNPDVVLLDIRMPHLDGYKTAEVLQEKYPDMKIIVLSMREEERHIIRMIELGVNGYLMKNALPEDVIGCIRFVMEHDYYFNKRITSIMRKVMMFKNKSNQPGSPVIYLSEREKEVLTLICQEYTAKEIGEKLFISFRTVEGHRKNLISKFGVKNTAGLVVFALKNELVDVL